MSVIQEQLTPKIREWIRQNIRLYTTGVFVSCLTFVNKRLSYSLNYDPATNTKDQLKCGLCNQIIYEVRDLSHDNEIRASSIDHIIAHMKEKHLDILLNEKR